MCPEDTLNILFDLEPVDGWVRAAGYLGHDGFAIDHNKVFDSFHKARPEVVVIPAGREVGTPLARALRQFATAKILMAPEQAPAADCPPDFLGGVIKPEFVCDVALVGNYENARHARFLRVLANSQLRLKIFGHGWPVVQCLGHPPAGDLADIYASAACVVDLDGNPAKVLAVWAAGGFPVSVRSWEGTGVVGLDRCYFAENEEKLLEHVHVVAKKPRPLCILQQESRSSVLQKDNLTQRLKELLESPR